MGRINRAGDIPEEKSPLLVFFGTSADYKRQCIHSFNIFRCSGNKRQFKKPILKARFFQPHSKRFTADMILIIFLLFALFGFFR